MQNVDLMVTSDKVPSMTIIKETFGETACMTLLREYVIDLALYYGNPNITADQIDSIASLILSTYYYFKPTEFLLAFAMMKSGQFRDGDKNRAKMYGNFNGEVICDCLYEFRKFRLSILDKAEREAQKQKPETNVASDDERKAIILEAAKTNPLMLNLAKANGWI